MTPKQQEKERQLMIDRVGGRFEFTHYTGEIKEIDLNAEWYCPHCVYGEPKPLKLNSDGLGLHCTEHYMVCEYEHNNSEGRAKRKISWGKGYQYPLSRSDLVKVRITLKEECVKKHRKSIEDSKTIIDKLKEELARLEQGELV